MPQARIWDLPGWASPLTVNELTKKPGIGYLSITGPTQAIVMDVTGALFVRKSAALRPSPPNVSASWLVQASATEDGVALYIPKTVYPYITRVDGAGNKPEYMPVAKVLQQQMLHYPKAEQPRSEPRRFEYPVGGLRAPDPGYTALKSVGAGTGTVPLVRNGIEIGTALVTWGDGSVAVEFLDAYGARGVVNAGAVRGFRLAVTSAGTSVTVLDA